MNLNQFYQERADAFLDDRRVSVTEFCRKYGIPYNPCPGRFALWVHGVRVLLPEATPDERAFSEARLKANAARVAADQSGVESAAFGLLRFPSELRL